MADPVTEGSKRTSALAFWLEETLGGSVVPAAAAAAAAVAGILYVAGWLAEASAAAVIAVAAPVAAAAIMVRPALDPGRDAGGRALLWAAAILTLGVTAIPALRTVLPGEPLFRGDLGIEGEAVPVPAGVTGRIRLLVNGKLGESGEPSVSFTLGGTEEPIEGRLERTYGYARVGRLGRTRVAHDHTSDWYSGTLRRGASELKLETLRGQLGGRMQVAVYRDLLPRGWLVLLSAAALLLAAAADARLAAGGNAAVASGMSLAFGLLVTYNATPASAVGPAVGGLVLGAIVGALAGAVVAWLGRKLVPAARRRPAGRSDRKPGGAAVA